MENRKKVIHPNFSEGREIRVQSADPKTQANQFLIEDNLKKALETILQYAKNEQDTELEQQCIFQLSRWNGLEKQKNNSEILQEHYTVEKAKIRKAIQDLIEKMQ